MGKYFAYNRGHKSVFILSYSDETWQLCVISSDDKTIS